MKPPHYADKGEDRDDLLAPVIPLRHRGPQDTEPRDTESPKDEPHPTHEQPPWASLLWDPPPDAPLLRRPATPAAAGAFAPTGGRTPARHASERTRAAALAGVAAITTATVVLGLAALLGHPAATPQPTGAPATGTPPIAAASAPESTARQPNPSKNQPATRGDRERGPLTRRSGPAVPPAGATQTSPAIDTASSSTPAGLSAHPRQPGTAATEFGFER